MVLMFLRSRGGVNKPGAYGETRNHGFSTQQGSSTSLGAENEFYEGYSTYVQQMVYRSHGTMNNLASDGLREQKKIGSGHWLIDHPVFVTGVYSVIITSSIQMGLRIDFPEFEHIWQVLEHVYTSLFTLELLVKIFLLRYYFFKSWWNRFDFVLVLLSIVDNWVFGLLIPVFGPSVEESPLSHLPVLRVLRVLRVARLARLLRVFKELGMIMKGIFDSLRTIFWVVFLLVLVLYVCSILCVDVIGREAMYPGFSLEKDEITESRMILSWNNFQYFGSISRSMYTLFNIILLAEFETVGRPVFEYQPFMVIFFLIFIVYTTFGVLNVIIGVIVDNTMVAQNAIEQEDYAKIRTQRLGLLKEIRDLVFALDSDENGVICIHEIRQGWKNDKFLDLLKEVNLPNGWSPEEFMHLLDWNGSGSLEFEEFLTCFYRLMTNDGFQQNCVMYASLNQVKNMVYILEENVKAIANHLKVDNKKMGKSRTFESFAELKMAGTAHDLGDLRPKVPTKDERQQSFFKSSSASSFNPNVADDMTLSDLAQRFEKRFSNLERNQVHLADCQEEMKSQLNVIADGIQKLSGPCDTSRGGPCVLAVAAGSRTSGSSVQELCHTMRDMHKSCDTRVLL